ncbi:hypothetical protein JEZ13_04640 [bacterium]|nr:hypothetical protein [bacterium]
MNRESKIKFKFNPTPTLAKLYEQQGLYQDALRIYEYLNKLDEHDFSSKLIELKLKLDPDSQPSIDDSSLTEIILSQDDNKQIKEVFELKASKAKASDFDEEKKIIIAEYNSLINILFSDEEKNYFKIVPSDEFYFNSNHDLVSIFTKDERGQSYDPVEDDMAMKHDENYKEILDNNQDINPEVTVEDFVNILYTYYSKETRISEIKIGDLFLLLSSIKIENS